MFRESMPGSVLGVSVALVISVGLWVQPDGIDTPRAHAFVGPSVVGSEVVSSAQYPLGIDVDDTGNIYIGYADGPIGGPAATRGLYVVPKFTGSLFGVTVTAGQEQLLAPLAGIQGVAVDDRGDVLFSSGGGQLYALTSSARTIFGTTTTADDSTFIKSFGQSTMGIALDGSGNLFAAGGPGGGVVVLPASTGTIFGDSVSADTPRRLSMVETDWEGDVALDDSGNLFVTQWFGSPSRDVLVVATASGTLYGEMVTQNQATALASFRSLSLSPAGIDVDDSGTIYVTSWPSTIYVMTPVNRVVLGQEFTANVAAYLDGSGGQANQGLAVDPTGGLISGAYSATLRISALAPPVVTSVAPASGDVAGGTNVTISGSGLTGAFLVLFGGVPATSFSVVDANTITAEVPPGSAGVVDVAVMAPGGTVTLPAGFTYTEAPPEPIPATPASPPRSVEGIAGDRSARVTWEAPDSDGSFDVTYYQAVTLPGARSCLVRAPRLACTITGLANDAAYSVSVRALTGAGWSAPSRPSAPFVPTRGSRVIEIQGSRDLVQGRPGVVVTGTSRGFAPGAVLTPWFRLSGQSGLTRGSARVPIDENGQFVWKRRTSKWIAISFRSDDGSIESNAIVIPSEGR